MKKLPIRDDNLRLILSKDHEKWFQNEFRDRWNAIAILGAILISSVVWILLAPSVLQPTQSAGESNTVYVEQGTAPEEIANYERDGHIVVVGEPETDTSNGFSLLEIIGGIFVVISVFAALITPFLIGKACLEIRTLSQWQREHEEFLKSYNRMPS